MIKIIIKKIKLKIKNNKGPNSCQSILCVSQSSTAGFVILFAVTISAILLSITLGVANISLREIKFGISAKDTNDAFFAADIGEECALYYDRSNSTKNAFTGMATPMICAGNSFSKPVPSPANFWSFTLSGLGSGGQGCSKVTVDKRVSPITQIISRGYNNGGSSCTQSLNTVERQIELNY